MAILECIECERLERNNIVSSLQRENEQWADVIDGIVETASVNDWHVDPHHSLISQATCVTIIANV